MSVRLAAFTLAAVSAGCGGDVAARWSRTDGGASGTPSVGGSAGGERADEYCADAVSNCPVFHPEMVELCTRVLMNANCGEQYPVECTAQCDFE